MNSNTFQVEQLSSRFADEVLHAYQQTPQNILMVRTFAEALLSATGIGLAEQIMNLNIATGKWLDAIGEFVGANRQDINIAHFENKPAEFVDENLDVYDEFEGLQLLDIVEKNYSTDDDFYRLYIKFVIAKNNGNGSIANTAEIFFNLFGTEVYISNLANWDPLAINIVTTQKYFNFIIALAQKDLLPIPAGIRIQVIIRQPPEGYRYFSLLGIKTVDIISGAVSNQIVEYFRLKYGEHSFNDDLKTIYMPNDAIYKL